MPAGLWRERARWVGYAPAENLERLDALHLASAGRTIDIAAYVLAEWPTIQALVEAAERGVTVRVYVDGGQAGHAYMDGARPFGRLVMTKNVTVKEKQPARPSSLARPTRSAPASSPAPRRS